MNENILNSGRFIKNIQITSRERTDPSTLTSNTLHARGVELVERDTSYPEGHIYSEILDDSESGPQDLRFVKTTKPYNPDFCISSQTLSYLFPHSPESATIVTPAQGENTTWRRFLETNVLAAGAQIDHFKQEGIDDFSLLIGGSFSPKTDSPITRAQNIKAAHLHTFLITHDYLSETERFENFSDFSNFLATRGHSMEEISMEARKFFTTSLGEILDTVLMANLKIDLEPENISSFGNEFRYPLYGHSFRIRSLDYLSSIEFTNILQNFSRDIEDFYNFHILPIFLVNTPEILQSEDPESIECIFRPPDEQRLLLEDHLRMLDITDPILTAKIKRLVTHLGGKLSDGKKNKFPIGAAYSFSALYDSSTGSTQVFLSFNPFGGGTFESIGLLKKSFTDNNEEQEERFINKDNLELEKEVYNKILRRLQQPLHS